MTENELLEKKGAEIEAKTDFWKAAADFMRAITRVALGVNDLVEIEKKSGSPE